MQGVSKTVPPKKEILKDIFLSFYPGAKIGVLGLNGSGKSTLLKIMAGIDKDFSGEAQPKKGIKIAHINNPLLHQGIESSEVFIAKTITACQTLANLVKSGNFAEELKQIRLFKSYLWLSNLYLSVMFCFFFRLIKNGVENHLKSPNPNLFFFDLYKLYQLTIAIKKTNQ